MSDSEMFWLAMFLVMVVAAIAAFVPGEMCTGNCRQGRDKCDCPKGEGKWEK